MEATMDDTTNRTEDTRIVRFTKDRDTLHKVGAPAEIIEGATFKTVIYAQNDKEHRAGGPSYLFIDKATGTTLEDRWMQKDRVERAGGLPFHTKRNRDGEIIEQSSDNGVKRQGPWHIDPDYAAIPDKPRAVDYETETHYRGTADIIDGRFHAGFRAYIKHRDGNLPSEIIRSPGGITQTFHLDNEEKRTDGGPTRIRINDSRAGGRPLVEQEWNTRLPGTRMDVPHREDGPASITLNHDGTIEEKWFKHGEPYNPNGHDLMKWASLKAEQGGPLWTEPGNRRPDGPTGPTQVLVHPDSGVRFYEAHHNILGRLDRADGPSQTIRDLQTGATLLLAHHKDGLHHRQEAAAVERFDRKTGKPNERLWMLEGKPANPDGPAIIRANEDRTYTGFAKDGRILYGRTIDNETGVVLVEEDRRNDGTKAPSGTRRERDGKVIFQEWRDSRYNQHRDNGPAVVAEGGHEQWYRNGRLYEPTEHEKAHWGVLKAEQGGLFWKPPAPEQDGQARPGGVKAAAAAAAAKAAETKTPRPKATDRGDER
jgi:hypothetical protein